MMHLCISLKFNHFKSGQADVGLRVGETEAFALSIEEQARKTLHAHLQIWVTNYHAIREKYVLKNANIPNIQSIFVTH